METYEIRVMAPDGQPSLVFNQQYLDVRAAVAVGFRISKGKPFVVWSEDRCVFASTEPPASPRDRPAA
jgi:hypothetical protein